jgi:glucose-6-phosphate-specific signal transduction histidine kinase
MTELDHIQQASVRLMRELLANKDLTNDFVKKSNDSVRRYLAEAKADGCDDIGAVVTAIMQSINSSNIAAILSSAVMSKTLSVVYKWLPEQGQREVAKELSMLTLDAVIPGWSRQK